MNATRIEVSAMRRSWAVILLMLLAACNSSNSNHSDPIPDAMPLELDAGAMRLVVTASPWGMTFVDDAGNDVLAEYADTTSGPVGSLGIFPGPPAPGSGGVASLPPLEMGEPQTPPERQDGWIRATELQSAVMEGDDWVGTVATTDAAWTLQVRARVEDDGVIAISVSAQGGNVQAASVAFSAFEDERFVGFGERGNAVNQSGKVLENYVAEGPYQDSDYAFINVVVPPAGVRWRPDTTYFPVPWLLSSRGYGVLLDNDELSYHRLGSGTDSTWAVEVEASEMRFRVFAGPQPADALRRFSAALGRQPHDYAPWFFGPWVQSDRDSRIDELRAADVPTSVTATFTHYLPCGSQRGNEDSMRTRTAARNAAGTAIHTYFNPMICVDFVPEFDNAEDEGALLRKATGETYIYDYQASRNFRVSQFDFSTPAGVAAYKTLTDEAIEHGYEGWMEDFGEYTPLDGVAADGTTGTAYHNRYVRDYHCGVAAATADAGKPLARFVRSGWTGSAACSPIVWGGDPSVSFGFDGLESSLYQALSMGTSGVGVWGSDIGGFFAFPPNALTPDLFDRWIQFGAFSAIMRSQKDGLNLSGAPRPQPWDTEHLALWRQYAKLRTQLFPYIQAAAEEYYATGMPIMRHHLLSNPQEPLAHGRDDQYLFGPDLLVAPVMTANTTTRNLYLPEGEWIEWWRSVAYAQDSGSFSLTTLRMHAGSNELVVDAPRAQIPLFVRAGAVIPMLAPDVYTLAEHGADDPTVVRLADRLDQLHLLAFPRGDTSGNFFEAGRYFSVETPEHWTLTLDDPVARTIHLQANLQSLTQPFTPCTVSVGGSPLNASEWEYAIDTGVFTVSFSNKAGELQVQGCSGR
jgi:alpha-D-xyloside xylohydrolase